MASVIRRLGTAGWRAGPNRRGLTGPRRGVKVSGFGFTELAGADAAAALYPIAHRFAATAGTRRDRAAPVSRSTHGVVAGPTTLVRPTA